MLAYGISQTTVGHYLTVKPVAGGLSRSKKNFLCHIKYNHVVCRLLVNNATDECATLLYTAIDVCVCVCVFLLVN